MKVISFIQWCWAGMGLFGKLFLLWFILITIGLTAETGSDLARVTSGAAMALSIGGTIGGVWRFITYQWNRFNKEQEEIINILKKE